MVKAFIDINDRANRQINILKATYGLKDKSQVIELAMEILENLDPKRRDSYVKKLKKIRKGKYTAFSSVEELRKMTR